ncbi:MAG: hypothetical protein ACQESF_02230 [Nanobdellota archaeon]
MDEINQTEDENKSCSQNKVPSKKELQEKKKREKKGLIFVIAFIIVIIIGVLAAIYIPKFIQDSKPKAQEFYTYKGFEFTKIQGTWYTYGYRDDKEFRITLRRGPKELETIPVSGDLLDFRSSNDFYYITFDPREENHDKYVTMAMAELTSNMRMHFSKNFTAACAVDAPVCNKSNTSIITCNNTEKPVIYLKRESGSSISVNENCAIIKGKGKELVDSADRLLYGMYGIMQNE